MDFTNASKYTGKATELFKREVLVSDFMEFDHQFGIDDTQDMRILESDLTLHGKGCDLTYNDEGELRERQISVAIVQAAQSKCFQDWKGYDVPTNFISQIVDVQNVQLKKTIAETIWNGSVAGGDIFNGFTYFLDQNASVTDEVVTLTALGTAYSLTYDRLYEGTAPVVTTSPAGTTYTEGTDYTIDYINGTITGISGGGITAGDDVLVDYTYALGATSLGESTPLSTTNIDDYLQLLLDRRATTPNLMGRGVATVFVSPAIYQLYITNRISANYYHDSAVIDHNSMWVFGYVGSVKMQMVQELTGVDDMYMTWAKNLVIGHDEQGEYGKSYSKVWFDDKTELLYFKTFTKLGTQIKFGDEAIKLR